MKPKKDQMHPEDMRNLIIFMLISVLLWFAYETYIGGPQQEALKRAKKARAELLLTNPDLLEPAPDLSRDEAIKDQNRITFINKEISGTISLQGGKLDDLLLNTYYETLEKKKNYALLKPSRVKASRFIDYGWVSGDKNLNLPNAQTQWQVQDNDILRPDLPVVLFWENGQGLRFERHINIDDEFLFTITQRVKNTSDKRVELHPYALVSQTTAPRVSSSFVSFEGPMGFIDGELEKIGYSSMTSGGDIEREAQRGWIGISDKYWLTAIMPEQNKIADYRFKYVPDPITNERNKFQTDFTGSAFKLEGNDTIEHTTHIYAGAKKVLTLEKYQKQINVDNLDLAVDFGWFWFFTYPFFLALHYIGLLVGNMGVAIIILTVVLRMAVFPLTNISYRSFAKMKVVAPQIAEIREQYVDDKEKLQEKIVEIYQREGVNPLSGCLPMIVQIPIFFAFYKILFSTIEIRHAPFFGWIQDLSAPDPTTVFNLFGLLPFEPTFLPMIGIWPCFMLIAMLMQKKLNPPPTDPTQRVMMNIFPFFLTFIMAGFASGLVIYWGLSAALSVLQQTWIMRSMGVPIYIFNKDEFEQRELEEKAAQEKAAEENEKADDESEEDSELQKAEEEPIKDIKPPKPKKKKKKK